jgi:PEGA domain
MSLRLRALPGWAGIVHRLPWLLYDEGMALWRAFFLTVGSLTLAACSPTLSLRAAVLYTVTSTLPGAAVFIDGQQAGTTPLTVDFSVSRWWVGLLNSPNGWAYGPETYTVAVLPPPTATAQQPAETQVVVPGDTPSGGTVFFDLRRPPA